MGILYKLSNFIPQNILKTLYEALIKPFLTYGIEAWFSAPDYILNKIRVLQKKSIRAICNLPYNSHTNNYFKDMKLLKIDGIFKENISVFFFKTLKEGQNVTVGESLIQHSEIHDYETRNRESLAIPRIQKSRTQKGFLFRGIKVWNDLNSDVKSSRTAKSFRRNVRNQLVNEL